MRNGSAVSHRKPVRDRQIGKAPRPGLEQHANTPYFSHFSDDATRNATRAVVELWPSIPADMQRVLWPALRDDVQAALIDMGLNAPQSL
jgi:hypothetical protein